eukprot:m.269391 g.269391  ORF g.269391 m.269391 type:complete len:90 (-) comp22820_c8_seq3:49-318(-)
MFMLVWCAAGWTLVAQGFGSDMPCCAGGVGTSNRNSNGEAWQENTAYNFAACQNLGGSTSCKFASDAINALKTPGAMGRIRVQSKGRSM